ncbi:MAG: maleylpyruvate isomerase family mycothiol-dependent enzyme [Acidimicrobiia bacterium]|nr:maleylpyruvate isomerase family mycothiol-dependent enzyme [Acidimicrobiia bacterium]
MRPAAELLLIESRAIRPVLEGLSDEQFELPTVCTGWRVRDVLAHCGAVLSRVVADDLHGFSPVENQADVDHRKEWDIAEVLEELFLGYESAAGEVDRAGGRLDGVGIGEWIHGGDVREPVGATDPYVSAGVDTAYEVLLQRSRRDGPGLDIEIDGRRARFGRPGEPIGELRTDMETFVRLCGGRRPDPTRFTLHGAAPAEMALFS